MINQTQLQRAKFVLDVLDDCNDDLRTANRNGTKPSCNTVVSQMGEYLDELRSICGTNSGQLGLKIKHYEQTLGYFGVAQ
jgi:hypothetical protein